MFKKIRYCHITLSFLMVILFTSASDVHAGKRKVIVSMAPLADFVRQVGGDRVEVKLLLLPGASPQKNPYIFSEMLRLKVIKYLYETRRRPSSWERDLSDKLYSSSAKNHQENKQG